MNEPARVADPHAGVAPPRPRAIDASKPSLRHRVARCGAVLIGLCAVAVTGFAAAPAAVPAPGRAAASWGAIAARPDGYGYAFNQPSRAAAEQVARDQCERPAGRPAPPGAPRVPGASSPSPSPNTPAAAGACEVRVWFDRSCGALATGNFGEWGAAVGADKAAATKAALAQCDAHLPTEPCRGAVSVCSLP